MTGVKKSDTALKGSQLYKRFDINYIRPESQPPLQRVGCESQPIKFLDRGGFNALMRLDVGQSIKLKFGRDIIMNITRVVDAEHDEILRDFGYVFKVTSANDGSLPTHGVKLVSEIVEIIDEFYQAVCRVDVLNESAYADILKLHRKAHPNFIPGSMFRLSNETVASDKFHLVLARRLTPQAELITSVCGLDCLRFVRDANVWRTFKGDFCPLCEMIAQEMEQRTKC
jgi:hypothetical protein